MKKAIIVDNLKCGGCAATIKNNLLKLKGISEVEVFSEEDRVIVTHGKDMDEDILLKRLAQLGYPIQGTSNIIQKGKSYLSCAIGKLDNLNQN